MLVQKSRFLRFRAGGQALYCVLKPLAPYLKPWVFKSQT